MQSPNNARQPITCTVCGLEITDVQDIVWRFGATQDEYLVSHTDAAHREMQADDATLDPGEEWRCSGDGPATHTECTFVTNNTDMAMRHFEATGHAVDFYVNGELR